MNYQLQQQQQQQQQSLKIAQKTSLKVQNLDLINGNHLDVTIQNQPQGQVLNICTTLSTIAILITTTSTLATSTIIINNNNHSLCINILLLLFLIAIVFTSTTNVLYPHRTYYLVSRVFSEIVRFFSSLYCPSTIFNTAFKLIRLSSTYCNRFLFLLLLVQPIHFALSNQSLPILTATSTTTLINQNNIYNNSTILSNSSVTFSPSNTTTKESLKDELGNECEIDNMNVSIDFDLNLFKQLNMYTTITDLIRSCFKNKESKYVNELYDHDKAYLKYFANVSSPLTNKSGKFFCPLKKVLYEIIIRRFKEFSADVYNKIETICEINKKNTNTNNNADFDYLDKLYILSEHNDMCGHYYRNSIRKSHLNEYILNSNNNNNKKSSTSNGKNIHHQNHHHHNHHNHLAKTESSRITTTTTLTASSSIASTTSTIDNFINKYKFNQLLQTIPIEISESVTNSLINSYVNNSYIDEEDDNNSIDSYSSFEENNFILTTPSMISEFNKNKFYNSSLISPAASSIFTTNLSKNKSKKPNDSKISTKRPKEPNRKFFISNCQLILLNLYLLSYKAQCDYKDFVDNINSYDCVSNNFSVKSDCIKCQVRNNRVSISDFFYLKYFLFYYKEAYKKWLCSSQIPFYDDDRLARPCQRYCFSVQNLCPFFRPLDNYGGQPVFHCRNVIQVSESRPEGYEDDDENYYDEGRPLGIYLT